MRSGAEMMASDKASSNKYIGLAILWLMTFGAGIGVANVYYIQPILPLVQISLNIPADQASLLAAISQIGYASGLFLLAPLGDFMDRKRLILIKFTILTFFLILTASAVNVPSLFLFIFFLGILGSVGQDFVPLAAAMEAPEKRGRTVGLITTGLLCGILLSRTISGVIGEFFGWRAIYATAAIVVAICAGLVWRLLPSQHATASSVSYWSVLHSLFTLLCDSALLRKCLITQALLAMTLGAFWSTISLMLFEPPLNLGASAAGTFGLAGAAGAFGASLFGRLADQRGPVLAIRIGCVFVAIAFVVMLTMQSTVTALVIGAALFDLGVMAALVSHQTIVTTIDPSARSRLNGLLMTGAMIGMALGAATGGWAWGNYGWTGVCIVGISAGLIALLCSFLPSKFISLSKESHL